MNIMEAEKKKENRKVWKIVGIVFGVLLVVALGIALRYIMAYNGFLDKITERKPEMKEYSVAVMDDSSIEDVMELKDKSVGLLKIDPKANNAAQYLKSIVEVNEDFYEDLDSLIGVLKNSISESVVLESDRLNMLKEEENMFYQNLNM